LANIAKKRRKSQKIHKSSPKFMRAAKAGKNIPKFAQRSINSPTVAKNSQVFQELSKAARTWRKIAQSCQSLAAFDNSWKTWLFLATVGEFMLLWANFGIFLPAFAALINFGLLL
jgi:hypothetical protein